ncbi:uncharacterized protein LOC125861522 [Solanum stenotomum]|uniref:uncharacterized protein LOC125861522 n=1 Tax=Solanum stenotomum TaxID=172797 RepID=UPI0020D16846|nr:uncharacterized protein LOC125861522 [Solanum stenotomum]
MLIRDIDISRLIVYLQQVEKEKLRDREEFRNKRAKTSTESGQQKGNANRPSFEQRQRGPVPSSASAPVPRNKSEYTGQSSQNFRAGPVQSQNSVAQGSNQVLACPRCGRVHPGKCRQGQTGCFKCGQEGHFMKECPKKKQVSGNLGSRAQSSSVVPPDRTAPRRATSSTDGGANCLYAITSRHDEGNISQPVREAASSGQQLPVKAGFTGGTSRSSQQQQPTKTAGSSSDQQQQQPTKTAGSSSDQQQQQPTKTAGSSSRSSQQHQFQQQTAPVSDWRSHREEQLRQRRQQQRRCSNQRAPARWNTLDSFRFDQILKSWLVEDGS